MKKKKRILTISWMVAVLLLISSICIGVNSYLTSHDKKTDSFDVDVDYVEQNNILITGRELNELIPYSATAVEFVVPPQTYSVRDSIVPENAIDVTKDKDGSVMAWMEDTTFYIVSTNGRPIYAQSTSDTYYMFANKPNLTYINMTELVMDEVTWIMLEGADNLTVIDIPRTANYLWQGAFRRNPNLEYINIPSDNSYYTSVDGVVYTKDLKTIVTYPAGNPRTEYRILSSVTSMQNHCFSSSRFVETVHLPSGLKSISFGCFDNSESLSTLIIPASVTSIGELGVGDAITNCEQLSTIIFEEGSKLTTIVENSFFNCGATEINLPASITHIGDGAFTASKNLVSINIPSTNNYYKTENGILFTKNGQKLMCYPSGKTDTEYVIPEGVKTFGLYAFRDFNNLVSITLPKTLTTLKMHSFYSSTSLTEMIYTTSIETWNSVVKENSWLTLLPNSFCIRLERTYTEAELIELHTLITGSEFNALIPDNIKNIKFVRSPMSIPIDAIDVTVAQEGFVMAWFEGDTMYVSTFLGGTIYANSNSGSMFANKPNLEYINMAEVNMSSIPYDMFTGSTNITSINLPSTLSSVSYGNFRYLENLTTLNIDSSNAYFTTVDGVLFDKNMTILYCYPAGLTNEVYTVPSTVTEIANYAFQNAVNLKTLNLPTSLNIIGGYVIYNTGISTIYIPKNVSIATRSLVNKNLIEIKVDPDNNNFTAVDGVLFSKDMKTLVQYPAGKADTSYIVPVGTTNLYPQAFYDSTNLVSISIPNTLTRFSAYCFNNCSNLRTIVFNGSVKKWNAITFDNNWNYGMPNDYQVVFNAIYTEEELIELHTLLPGSSFRDLISNDITAIEFVSGREIPENAIDVSASGEGFVKAWVEDTTMYVCSTDGGLIYANSDCDYMFQNKTNLGYVNTENLSMTIAMNTFDGCTGLKIIDISATIDVAREGVFMDCSTLTDVNVDNDNPVFCSVDGIVFTKDMKVLVLYPAGKTDTTYVVPDGIKEIAMYAFYMHRHLVTVSLPSSVEYIGNNSFTGSSKLSIIDIPADSNLVSIGMQAFAGTKITTITIPKLVSSIGSFNVFGNFMTSINVDPANEHYTSIDGVLFDKNMTKLICYPAGKTETSYSIPDCVKTIPSYAFMNCKYLTSLNVPFSVQTIQTNAFYSTSKIQTINYNGTEEQWNAITKNNGWNSGLSADCVFNFAYTEAELVEIHTLVTGEEFRLLIPSAATSVIFTNSATNIPADAVDLTASKSGFVKGWLEDTTFYVASVDGFGIYANADTTNMFMSTKLTHINMTELNITSFSSNTFMYANNSPLIVVDLPASLQTYNSDLNGRKKLTTINIDPSNEYFVSVDGVLFSKDMKTLVQYPAGKTNEHYTIPSTVTTIGRFAFSGANSTSVTIPNGVLNINFYAFSNCAFTTVYVPSSVKFIDGSALRSLYLTEINVDPANENYVSVDGVLYTKDMKTLTQYPGGKTDTEYIIPEGTTTIFDRAFADCLNLTKITLPNTITKISIGAFASSTNLQTLVFYGTEAQWNQIFKEANWNGGRDFEIIFNPIYTEEELIEMHTLVTGSEFRNSIPSTATSIIFTNSAIDIPADAIDLTASQSGFVKGWLDGTTFYVASVDGYGIIANSNSSSMFGSKTNLVSIDISCLTIEGITTTTFGGSSNLQTIVLPSSIETVSSDAFANFSKLTSISISSESAYFATVDGILFNKDMTQLVRYPAGKTETEYTIPETVIAINSQAFRNSSYLKTININANTTSIGSAAFHNCTLLTNVNFTEDSKLNSIGNMAFYRCTQLTSITLPDSLQTIQSNAFALTLIAVLDIPANVQTLSYSVFNNMSLLEAINVHPNNTSMASIDGVLFNKDITTLLYYPLAKTDNNYQIPSSVTRVENRSFYNNTYLNKIIFPASLTSIGTYAFSGATNFNTIYFYGTLDQWNAVTIEDNGLPYTYTVYTIEDITTLNTLIAGTEFNALIPSTATSVIFTTENMTIPADAIDVTANQSGCVMAWLEGDTFYVCSTNGFDIYANEAYNSMFSTKSNLTRIDMTDLNITTIASNMFNGCSKLTTVDLPKTLQTYAINTFTSCRKLTTLNIDSSNAYFTTVDGVLFNKNMTQLVYYPAGKTDASYTVPKTVTNIYNYAFANNTSLTEILFAENSNLTAINAYAFSGCTGLTSFTLPNTTKTINAYAFANTKITTITIPASLTQINMTAFVNANLLTEIIVDAANPSFSSVDGILFNKAMTQLHCYPAGKTDTSYLVPAGIIYIYNYSFARNTYLTEITLPSTITNINAYAFQGCTKLTTINFCGTEEQWNSITFGTNWNGGMPSEYIVNFNTIHPEEKLIADHTLITGSELNALIPSTATSVEFVVLPQTYGITDSVIPADAIDVTANQSGCVMAWLEDNTFYIVSIDGYDIIANTNNNYMFRNKNKLTHINMAELKISTINNSMFANCTSLTSIVLPNTLQSYSTNTFSSSSKLEEIIIDDKNSYYTTIDGVLYNKAMTILYCYPANKAGTSYTIPDTVRNIYSYAAKGNKNLTEVIIPYGATNIGTQAFYNCVNLAIIEIPSTVTSIGTNAFTGTAWLANQVNAGQVVIINNIIVDVSAASGDFVIPNTMTSIPANLFKNNTNITSITIPASVISIGANAFDGCTNLTSVIFEDGSKLTTINNYAFANCTNLTSFTIPDTVTYIGTSAFENCSNITTMHIPAKVSSIGNNAFGNMTSLTGFTVDSENTTYRAFNGVLSTYTTTTSNNVVTYHAQALICYPAGKTDVTSVRLDCITINPYALNGCQLESISFFSSGNSYVQVISAYAFYNCPNLSYIYLGGIKSIGANAFDSCPNLATIQFRDIRASWNANVTKATGWNNGMAPDCVIKCYGE